jgi:peptide/nickel transport system substrate-binding protein
MNAKWFIGLVVAAAMMAVASTGEAAEAKRGGTLVVGLEAAIGFLDPHTSNSGNTHRVNDQIFERLFSRDYTQPNDGSPPALIPKLATGFEVSSDALVYTITLREGVKFHDGTDFNAEAVEFNIRRMWDEDFEFFTTGSTQGGDTWNSLKSIEVLDSHTIRLTMFQPFAFFIEKLATTIGLGMNWMGSPTAFRTFGNEDVKNHPTGTGAFRFVERVRGQRVVLERNPDYWDDRYPYLDRIVFRELSEASTRVNALLAGEVDQIAVVPPDQIKPLEDAGYTIKMGPTPHSWFINFNHSKPPFDDVRVRRAVNLAINREDLAKDLLQGTSLPSICFCARTSPTFSPPPEWAGYEYNPEKAMKLLAEAGYADGFSTIFETSTEGSGQIMPVQIAEWIQRDLVKVGIKMELKTYEWLTYVGRWFNGMTDEVGMNQISTGSNSDYWIWQLAHPDSVLNSGYLVDAALGDLLDRANRATDKAQRDALILQAVEREKDQAHHAPIVNDNFPVAMAEKVQGFVRPADWTVDYRIVWIDE